MKPEVTAETVTIRSAVISRTSSAMSPSRAQIRRIIVWLCGGCRPRAFTSVPPYALEPTALKFPGLWGLVSGFLRLVTVWRHVDRGGVTGSGGP